MGFRRDKKSLPFKKDEIANATSCYIIPLYTREEPKKIGGFSCPLIQQRCSGESDLMAAGKLSREHVRLNYPVEVA